MTTYHGMVRTKERTGLCMETSLHFIRNAYERGKDASAFKDREREYLMAKSSKKNESRAVAYNGYCLIFVGDGYCVTMYKLPAWFGRKAHYDGKERIRNVRKYCRHNKAYSN